MSAKKFILKEAFVPVIDKKLVKKDTGMGGLKLVYETSNKKSTLTGNDKKIAVFLKPYKETLSEDKDVCRKLYGREAWGNTSCPLSNVWLEIKEDYSDFNRDFMKLRPVVVTDITLIKFLNSQAKEFNIGSDEPVTKLSLTERARFFIDAIRNW